MKYHSDLIYVIKSLLDRKQKLVNFLCDTINIGKEASYRRIRGDVEFSASEIFIIAQKLNISLDFFLKVNNQENSTVLFSVYTNKEQNPESIYASKIKQEIEALKSFANKNTVITGTYIDLPEEMFYNYPYLMRLRILKVYSRCLASVKKGFPFLRDIHITNEITGLIREKKKLVYSVQKQLILGTNVFHSIIVDILYFYKLNLITEKEIAQLRKELNGVLGRIDNFSSKHTKAVIYTSEFSLDYSFMYIESDKIVTAINLYTPDALISQDKQVCDLHKEYLEIIMQNSVLISQSGLVHKQYYVLQQKRAIERLFQNLKL